MAIIHAIKISGCVLMPWKEKYMQIPFVEKGRDFSGCDCYGLMRLVLQQERGIELPDYLDVYDTGFKEWSDEERRRLQATIDNAAESDWQEVDQPQAFDVILLKIKGAATHVGIVIDGQRMLHCFNGSGTSIEKFNGMRWQNSVVGFFRWVN